MTTEQRIEANGGMLTWDGRVLELFKTDGRDDGWRVHASTVASWELVDKRKENVLRVTCGRVHFRTASIPDAEVPKLHAVMAEVDAAT